MNTDSKPTREIFKTWHNDPANWKWGVFYYNRQDKRLFPPKKYPALGWTINYANPFSILALALIVVIVILLGKLL